MDLSAPVGIDLILKCLQVNWLLFQTVIDFQIIILIIFHLAIFLSLCSGSLTQSWKYFLAESHTRGCSRTETHLLLCLWKGHRTHHNVYQQWNKGQPPTSCTGLPRHSAIFVTSRGGWRIYVNARHPGQMLCMLVSTGLGRTGLLETGEPDELSCSSPHRITCVPVHIRTESFNRFTLAFMTAGETSSIPAQVLLGT